MHEERKQNLFPLYIPSKGRSKIMLTPKYLDRMGCAYRLVVEEQEYSEYLAAFGGDKSKLLVLDMEYKRKYRLCDSYGLSRSTGSGPARNFIWDHSISEGHTHHWIMDDNIKGFYRINNNNKNLVRTPAFFRAMEDFSLRYKNVGMAGPEYKGFTHATVIKPHFRLNTRVYSCNLIRNDLPFRWRGRYNEDSILSLDMLKAGWCTVLFLSLLQNKINTQRMRGGNTSELYTNGTREKSQMLAREHPDVSKVVTRYGRVHHLTDHSRFRQMRLQLADGVVLPQGVDNFGMELLVDPSAPPPSKRRTPQ